MMLKLVAALAAVEVVQAAVYAPPGYKVLADRLVYIPSLSSSTTQRIWSLLAVTTERTGQKWAMTNKSSATLTLSLKTPRIACASQKFSASYLDGFVLYSQIDQQRLKLRIESLGEAGLLAGLRRLLRHLAMTHKTLGRHKIKSEPGLSVSPTLCVVGKGKAAERWAVRGHQFAVDHHPDTCMFRTWQECNKFARDLQVFGANQVEMAHISAKQFDGIANASATFAAHQMNVSIWTGGLNTSAASMELTSLIQKMPRLDSVFFPGGDGGKLVWTDIKAAAVTLKAAHGKDAMVWVSAQELNQSSLEDFVVDVGVYSKQRDFLRGTVGAPQRWLGVVYGPHVRVPLAQFMHMLGDPHLGNASDVPVRQYPDIAHIHSAQLPVPHMHSALMMTHDRQSVNPLPQMQARVIELRSNGSTPTIGVGAYSEGLNDDLNKMVWSAMGEDGALSVGGVVEQYVRYFFDARLFGVLVPALMGLERSWGWQGDPSVSGSDSSERGDSGSGNGPDADADANADVDADSPINPHIRPTLELLQEVERAVPSTAAVLGGDWRLQMYVKRGYFDALVQLRFAAGKAKTDTVLELLAHAAAGGAGADAGVGADADADADTDADADASAGTMGTMEKAVAVAYETLLAPDEQVNATRAGLVAQYRAKVAMLANALNESVGAEVLQTQDIYLNMQTVDAPVSDAPYFASVLENITKEVGPGASAAQESRRRDRVMHGMLCWHGTSLSRDVGSRSGSSSSFSHSCVPEAAHTYYDDLGSVDPAEHVHLDPGEGTGADPSFYHTPLHVGHQQHCLPFLPPANASNTSAPGQTKTLRTQRQPPSCTFLGLQQHAQTYFDQPLTLHYDGLEARGVSTTGYNLSYVAILVDYAHYQSEFQILANECVVQDYGLPIAPTRVRSVHIPLPCVKEQRSKDGKTSSSTLTVTCRGRRGLGGSGPTCQLAHVWLEPA